MRDIKYRAWDCEVEHMFYSDKPEGEYFFEFIDGKLEGLAIRPPESLSIDAPPEPWSESYPVEQFTGLCDKNGKEIYDDDLYKAADGIVYRVQMKVDGWGLFGSGKKGPVRSLYWINVCDATRGEVIGNIHEHPNLMEHLT